MSLCQLKRDSNLDVDKSAFDAEVLLVAKNITADFVTLEQYQLLLFVLKAVSVINAAVYAKNCVRREN